MKQLRTKAVWIIVVLAVAGVSALADPVTVLIPDHPISPPDGKDVLRDRVTIPNDSGNAANDLHVTIFQKEQDILMQGGSVQLEGGTGAVSGRTDHSVTIDITNIDVPPNGNFQIEWALDLSEKNKRWVEWQWTQNGDDIGKPGKGHGHEIKGPNVGGGGGNPNPGGGGAGGQGGGGGTGFFVHPMTIYNEEDKAVEFRDFYLLASMEYYDSLDDIPWDTVDPIDMGGGPVMIPAEDTWSFDFETTGSYLDGHIYYKYTIIDGESMVVGDHPVYVPEPATLAILAAGGLLLRRRRKG